MNKQEITQLLTNNHHDFIEMIRNLSDDEASYAPPEKWNAVQQLDHIIKSVSPVNMALGLPKFLVNWKFGVANRPSKTYTELVNKYDLKLLDGGKASSPFVPADSNPTNKETQLIRLTALVTKLNQKTAKHSEEDLDKYILPHPLLGKLTFREMLYFTACHVAHHQKLIEKALLAR